MDPAKPWERTPLIDLNESASNYFTEMLMETMMTLDILMGPDPDVGLYHDDINLGYLCNYCSAHSDIADDFEHEPDCPVSTLRKLMGDYHNVAYSILDQKQRAKLGDVGPKIWVARQRVP